MKTIFKNIYIIAGLFVAQGISAQVLTNQQTNPAINNSNVFLDASTYYSIKANDDTIGKGLVFPDVDLTKFSFNLTYADGQTFPTYFNGMLVYNIGKGKTGANKATQGIQVDVEPGFYYFYNPGEPDSVETGKWIRVGGGANATSSSLVATGTFTHDGGITAVLANMPTDIKAITSIKIVRTDANGDLLEGGVAATTFYSYDKVNKKMAFGQGAMATSMPAGTYSYTIEYTK